jgi:ribosomal protein S18
MKYIPEINYTKYKNEIYNNPCEKIIYNEYNTECEGDPKKADYAVIKAKLDKESAEARVATLQRAKARLEENLSALRNYVENREQDMSKREMELRAAYQRRIEQTVKEFEAKLTELNVALKTTEQELHDLREAQKTPTMPKQVRLIKLPGESDEDEGHDQKAKDKGPKKVRNSL